MTELQSKLLDMLKWYNIFCRDHGIKYYAVGGTLLGAVRHNGFIPWDDDIDLAMPRDDYEEFERLMENKIYNKYILETYKSIAKDYCYPYDKLYDTTTTLVEDYRIPLRRGIFLDIFPLDGAGNTEEESNAWCKKINRRYYFYLARMAAVSKRRQEYKNLAIHASRMIPNLIVDNRKFRIKLNEKCKKFNLGNSKYAGNLLGNWGIREVVPVEVIGKPKEYKFEDISILGIEDYDTYLTHIYGNWRNLPPKDKRVSQHNYLHLDLESPFNKPKE